MRTAHVAADPAPGGGFIFTIKAPFTVLGGGRTYEDTVAAMWAELDWLAQFVRRADS